MTKHKTINIRIPREAWLGIHKKRVVMENILKEELHNPKIKVHFTDALNYLSNKKVMIYNDELVDFIKKNRKIKRVNLI